MLRDPIPSWHRESYDRFLREELPRLLSERLPVAVYQVSSSGGPHVCITLGVAGGDGAVEVVFDRIPAPDEDGVFHVGGQSIVVVPVASTERLAEAEIRCVGERLLAHVDARLGHAPTELEWSRELLRSWVPLDRWIEEFLSPGVGGQVLEDRNWLSRIEHLRRLVIPDRQLVVAPGQRGRVCLIQSPEGPNIGRVVPLALGAEIQNGHLEIVDERPECALSVGAGMIPLLAHDDPARALMGANMMRQWLVPPEPEPALVQSGHEPEAPGFWCGRNLLTAFVSLGGETFEDGIVVSESAATRLDWPRPLEPGDKISNRHGTKGVISRIRPDEDMPRLQDGTPIELVFSFIGCHARRNFGQIREAVLGRLARAEGHSIVAAPYDPLDEVEIRERLRSAGLPESGMETLTHGPEGKPLERPSTAGWVYWGKTQHVAAEKIQAAVSPDHAGAQRFHELDVFVLRDAGAFENLAEAVGLRNARHEEAASLPTRVAAGPVERPGSPSPCFIELTHRLEVAGIRARLEDGKARFAHESGADEGLSLARPIPHPWLPGSPLHRIGPCPDRPELAAVVEANERLQRLLAGDAPGSLLANATQRLEAATARLFDALLPPDEGPARGPEARVLRQGGRVLFSGRAVAAPGYDLAIDEVGLPEEMAWTLFAPLVARRQSLPGIDRGSEESVRVLDEVLRDSWVLVNRNPSVLPTSILAFRPRRRRERVVRIHPLACPLLNADFDGDQVAVSLPLTEAAQQEAASRLTVAAHLERDPELVGSLLAQDAVWGLAERSRTPDGRDEIERILGRPVRAPDGFVTRETLASAVGDLTAEAGTPRALVAVEELMRLGFAAAARSGASIGPFPSAVRRPADARRDLEERISARTDYDAWAFGAQLLAVKSGARGTIRMLVELLGHLGDVRDENGDLVVIGRGLVEGLALHEHLTLAVGARPRLARFVFEFAAQAADLARSSRTKSFNVLARAMRAESPGIVFAQAAATGEVDRLQDLDSRLFVGLPAEP